MRVEYRITADGADITAAIADRLLEAEIIDQSGVVSDRLTLTIDDRDQRVEFPAPGARLEVWLGYAETGLVRMGSWVVDEVDVAGPARVMTIRAHAADMTGGIKAPRERSWHQNTLGDVVKAIAAEHSLKPAIAPALAAVDLGHVDQTESDMQLLQRLCADHGATCKVADGRLVVAVAAGGKATGGAALPRLMLRAEDGQDWQAVVEQRTRYNAVRAYYQHGGRAKRTGVVAGKGKPELHLKNTYATAAEARQAAESRLKALGRGASKMTVDGIVGDPSIYAERPATVSGFRRGVDGDGWVVTSVQHRFSGDGYVCRVDLETTQS